MTHSPDQQNPGTPEASGSGREASPPQYAPPQYAPPAAPQYAQPAYAAAPGTIPGPGEPFNGAADPEDLNRPLYGATFGQAVKRFFRSYAKFNGRASRSEYWWTALFIFLVQLIPLVLYIVGVVMLATSAASSTYIDEYGDTMTSPGAAPGIGGGVALLIIGLGLIILIGLALLVPGLAISWRRLHDANFSGAFWCLSLIPSVGSLIVLIFMVLSSNPEGRRFDVS